MAALDPKRQLLFDRIYTRRQADGQWPTAVDLQREFASTHPEIRVREIVGESRGLAGLVDSEHRVQLTLRALVSVPAARPVLEGYLKAVRAMIARFQDRSTDARYSRHDLADLNLDPAVEKELGWLLEEDRWPFGSGTGSGPDGTPWEYDIDDRIMAAADIDSVEELVALRYGERYEPEDVPPAPEPLTGAPGSEPKVNPDRPIARPEDDLLGRLPLARALALQAITQPHQEGFVMGVSGPWGSGKTSLLNLMVDAIEEAGDGHVVRFDPWMFSSSEELVMRFLREMSTQMIREPKLKRVASQIASYAEVLAPLAALAPAPWLVPVFAASGRASKRFLRKVKEAPSAQEQRDNVREALLALKERLVVVIDDLDRLQEQELRDIVRLVKLVGDFPNTTYVLAYDQQRVAIALTGSEDEGNEFLEKIIQLSHDVPPTPQGALERVLVKTISDAVGDLSTYHFNQDVYSGLFATGVRDLFTSVRDVRRYGNALPVTLSLVKDEIELSDILALEALRVRTPKSFAFITGGRDVLTSVGGNGYTHKGPPPAVAQQQLTAIMQAAGNLAPHVEAIVRRLFPACDRYFNGGMTYGPEWMTAWRRDHRVAHPDVFDIYLNRALPEGTLPAPLVQQTLSLFNDADALTELLNDLDPTQLEGLLERLEDFQDRFPADHPEIPVSVLYNQRSRLRTESRHVFDLSARYRVPRVVLRVLRRLEPEKAEEATSLALAGITSLSDRADLVQLVGHRPGTGNELVSKDAADRMEEAIFNEVLATESGHLAAEHDLLSLLLITQRGRTEDFNARITELVSDDEFMLRLLRAAITDVVAQSLGGGVPSTRHELNWPALAQLVGEPQLRARVREIAASDLSDVDERTRIAIRLADDHITDDGDDDQHDVAQPLE